MIRVDFNVGTGGINMYADPNPSTDVDFRIVLRVVQLRSLTQLSQRNIPHRLGRLCNRRPEACTKPSISGDRLEVCIEYLLDKRTCMICAQNSTDYTPFSLSRYMMARVIDLGGLNRPDQHSFNPRS